MKKFCLLLIVTCLCITVSFAQNGPTLPSVDLTWNQGTGLGITANCVYRGTAPGVYTLPAIFCSTTFITTYTDTTVTRGTTYHYAVTAKIGAQESGYSNDATAAVPSTIAPPVLGTPVMTKLTSPTPDCGDDGMPKKGDETCIAAKSKPPVNLTAQVDKPDAGLKAVAK